METYSVLVTLVRMGIGAAIAYGVWFLISPKGPAKTPFQSGRKWVAWPWAVVIFTVVPMFLRTGKSDELLGAVLLLVVSAVVFFPLGYFIGRSKGLGRKSENAPSNSA